MSISILDIGFGNLASLKNAFDFRDRIVRDKNFKAYIDTLNKIYEIIELKSDFYEENNLLNSKREDVISGIKKFESVIKKYPSMDASPIYTKYKNSLFDIHAVCWLSISVAIFGKSFCGVL